MSTDELLSRIAQLERRIEQLERIDPPERARVIPPGKPILGRIVDVEAGSGTEPTRFYKVVERKQAASPTASQQLDDDVGEYLTIAMDEDGHPQPFSQDCVVLDLGHHRCLMPVPSRVVFVQDDGGDPTAVFPDRTGSLVDVKPSGVTTSGFGAGLPMLPINPASRYYESKYPWTATGEITVVGGIYPAIHVYPLPDEPISGVDDDDGFYIVMLAQPVASEVKTFSDSVVLASAETVTVTLGTDSAGRATSIELTKS